MKETTPGKYDTDSPQTREQAEELLKRYYKDRRPQLSGRPNLLSWKLSEDGIMTVVDGTSGRELEFVTNSVVQEKLAASQEAEDAEVALLAAQAKADEAEARANEAEARLKEAETQAKEAEAKARKAEAKADKAEEKPAEAKEKPKGKAK